MPTSSYTVLLRKLRTWQFLPGAALFHVDLHGIRNLNSKDDPRIAAQVIAAVGKAVAEWAGAGGIGLRLWSNEFVAAKAAHVVAKPVSLSHEEAAGVPLAALTAWQAVFDRAGLSAGQRILIHAGAGGVGGFAIQFARETGAIVTTTASPANTNYVRQLGADEVIDYQAEKFENGRRDFDVVIDLIGGETQARSYTVLRRGGVLVNAWGAIMQDKAEAAGVRGVKVAVEPDGGQLGRISALIDAGKVRVSVAKVFALADCAKALDESRTWHVRGKSVLKVLYQLT